MREYKIKDWNDFNDKIFYNSWNNDIQRYRSNFIFRGVSHAEYDLLPSLNRVCNNRLYLEKPLLRNFQKYASLELSDNNNFWEIVSLAQHHGLPTRLLDWTFSPYVAAHFATENIIYNNCDCAIWCIDFVAAQKYLPLYFQSKLQEEMANGFSIDFLKTIVNDFERLSELEENNEPFPLFFEPSSIDNRIINQYALFSVMSNPNVLISEWLEKHSELGFKIIIPADVRMEIRDKLDQINMTERIIYPGLDGLCKWLSRHYTPKEKIFNEDMIVKRIDILFDRIKILCNQLNVDLDNEIVEDGIKIKQTLDVIVVQYITNNVIWGELRILIDYKNIPFLKLDEGLDEETENSTMDITELLKVIIHSKKIQEVKCLYLFDNDVKGYSIELKSSSFWGEGQDTNNAILRYEILPELEIQYRYNNE